MVTLTLTRAEAALLLKELLAKPFHQPFTPLDLLYGKIIGQLERTEIRDA